MPRRFQDLSLNYVNEYDIIPRSLELGLCCVRSVFLATGAGVEIRPKFPARDVFVFGAVMIVQ